MLGYIWKIRGKTKININRKILFEGLAINYCIWPNVKHCRVFAKVARRNLMNGKGDRSGDWLYRALHKQGFANQPGSQNKYDGLVLKNVYITAVVKCAPPLNKPTPKEIKNCSDFLDQELLLLTHIKTIIALGQIALNGIWPKISDGIKKPKFGHNVKINLKDGKKLILSYHPSQQNTFTGKLTEPMFDKIFRSIRPEPRP